MSDETREHRHIVFFNDAVDEGPIMDLIQELESSPSVDLFFSTEGGTTLLMEMLIHCLNNHGDVNVYLNYQLMSAGIDLLTKFNGKVFITPGFELMMIHCYDRKLYSKRDMDFDKKRLNEGLAKQNAQIRKEYKELGFSRKELKRFDKGEDVWWYRTEIEKHLSKLKNVTIL